MLEIHIGTIFPEFFSSPLAVGNIKRAIQKSLMKIFIHDLRDFTPDPHRKVDDRPYGGGSGMVMLPEPFFRLCFHISGTDELEMVKNKNEIVLFTPRGEVFNQKTALELARSTKPLIFLCGRYEGIDERVAEHLATKQISLGDFILSGGEPAALAVVDAITRLIPGVVGDKESLSEESFDKDLLEYPQYTRPEVFLGFGVPKVLLSGNHRLIESYRFRQRLIDTMKRRPDLFKRFLQDEKNLELARKYLGDALEKFEKNDI